MAAKDVAKLDYDYIKFWIVPLAALVALIVSIKDNLWQGILVVVTMVLLAIWLYELNCKYQKYRASLK